MLEHNPILVLLVQIGLILALSRIMGWLFGRMHQPQVIGEMVAGIMLGPSLLGFFAPPVFQTLFPRDSIEYLHLLSQVGVIFFLFLVGLEFDPNLLKSRGRAALAISASSIAVPFAIGVALTFFLYPRVFSDEHGTRFVPTALFMGAAISVTAFPVLARILTERNLQKTHVGAISLTGAAVNDVLAWCMLAAVVAVTKFDPRHGPASAFITVAMAAVYVLFMLFAVRPFLRRLEAVYDRRGKLSQNLMALIFLMVLASAYATERIGIHALFGAFIIGLVMPKRSHFVHELSEKLTDFTIVFLLPIFFAFAGLSTDLSPRNFGAHLWGYAALIIVAACVGKIGGTAIAARASGQSWRESSAIGVLMNTRGLMELIILTIGLTLGVLNDDVFSMMVVMAIVTTAMTAPLLSLIYPAHLFGRDEAAAKAVQARRAFSVLVPVALPESGAMLARIAATLVDPADRGGRIIALHLRRPNENEAYHTGLDDTIVSQDALRPLLNEAERQQVVAEPVSFVTRDIAADIAAVARAQSASLVLMGFHKPVFGKTILGGTVHRVLSQTPVDVAVFVDHRVNQFKRLLVPYLGSSHDQLAMKLAQRISRNTGAAVTILHVVAPERSGTTLDAKANFSRIFSEPQQTAPVEFKVVHSHSPVQAVLKEAEEFDLVIIGVSERWGLESHLFGWRSERIARECSASLLIVRRYRQPAAATEETTSAPTSQPRPTSV